jgi:predicted unusual protein kinase regulating ubiquinone biosynthesis (AarF/ABC1/UbiB family)
LRECAEIVIDNLRELGGGLAKLAQISANTFGDFPDDIRARMVERGRRVVYMAPGESERIVARELGRAPHVAFTEWDPVPSGGGCIGQVHAARDRDGRAVCVKVKFDRIADKIRSDFRSLRAFSRIFDAIYPGHQTRDVFLEWERLMLQESDFRLELANQRHARELFAPLADVVVPAVVPELSTGSLVTSELVRGKSFRAFLANATQAERNQAGVTIFLALAYGLARGFFKHDVHEGNFLFDGDKVVLDDFGACLVGEAAGAIPFWRHIRAFQRGDTDLFRRYLRETGVIKDAVHFDVEAEIALNQQLYYRPFLTDAPFAFTPEFARAVYVSHVRGNANLPYRQLPLEQLPLTRLHWSLYGLLDELQAEANWYRVALELDEELKVAAA